MNNYMGQVNMVKSNSQFTGIDLFKYLMAFGVVAIHFQSAYGLDCVYGFFFDWFIHLAVPFFFITSGYLLQRKLSFTEYESHQQIIIKRCVKLARIWISWMLVYLPLVIMAYRGQNFTFISACKSYIFNAIIYGWAPWAGPLWFLYSMIWIFVLIAFCHKIRNYKWYLLGLFLFNVFIFWLGKYGDNELLNFYYKYFKNILGGGVYIIIGMLLYEYKKFDNWVLIIGTLLLSILLYHYQFPYAVVLGGFSLFAMAMKLTLRPEKMFLNLRSQSMWIYYLHEYIIFFIFNIFALNKYFDKYFFLLIIVYCFCALTAKILSKLQNISTLKYLKVLVN